MRKERNTLKLILFNLDALAAGIALVLAMLLLNANIIMRYVFTRPLLWAQEAEVGLLLWAIFLGGAYVYRRGANLNSNMVVNRFSSGTRFLIKLMVDFLVILSLAALTYGGILYVSHFMDEVMPVLGIPRFYVDGAIPCGFGLAFLYAVFFFIRDLLTAEVRKGDEDE